MRSGGAPIITEWARPLLASAIAGLLGSRAGAFAQTAVTPDATGNCLNCIVHELLHNGIAIQLADNSSAYEPGR